MISLDIFTVIFMSVILHTTMGILFAAIYRAGLGGRVVLHWSLALITVSIGIGFLLFRDPNVAVWTLPIGNLLIFTGAFWSVAVLRRLLGKPLAPLTIVIAGIWIVGCIGYITFIGQGQSARSVISTSTLAAFALLVVVPLALKKVPSGSGLSRLIVLSGYAAMFLVYGTLALIAGFSHALPDALNWPSLGSQVLWAFMLGLPTMVWSSLGCLSIVIEDVDRQSQAFLERARAVVRKNPLAIILTDAQSHRVIDINDAFLRMFGLESRQVLGQNANELGLFEQSRIDAYRELLATDGMVTDLIVTRDTHEGANRTLKVSGHRLWLGSRYYYLTFINDISNEMLAADVLRREKELAQHEAQEKSRFLAMMSHEFRTPLSAAAGLAALLKSDEKDPGKQRRLDGILEAMSALTHLVDDVLDLSRLQNNDLVSVVGVCVPALVVERVEAICGPSAARKGLDLRIEIDPRLPERIIGDQNRIAQVTINLMQNAIKFTETGSVTLFVGCAPSGGQNAERLMLEVRDTGPGIPKDEHERLFRPFQQGRAAKIHDGVGLGLSICRQLVTMMDGDISVDDNPGGGSIFRVTLPLNIAPTNEPETGSDDIAPHHSTPWTGLRVLIAEDTGLNREVLAEQLTRVGAQVVPVADGGPACTLAAVAEPPFDVVLLDMHMQGVSGLEASMRLRATQRGQSLLIAALTAYSEESDREACEAAGMDLFFSKPYDLNEMGHSIAAAAATRAPLDAEESARQDAIGFDVLAAARGWADDATPLATLLIRFADAYGGIRGHLTGLFGQGRVTDLQTMVHQIRGIAALLRAQDLQQEAARIETLLQEQKLSGLEGRLDRLEHLVQAHVSLVQSAYASSPPEAAPARSKATGPS
jgi:PAS domain S-box-containing protein